MISIPPSLSSYHFLPFPFVWYLWLIRAVNASGTSQKKTIKTRDMCAKIELTIVSVCKSPLEVYYVNHTEATVHIRSANWPVEV